MHIASVEKLPLTPGGSPLLVRCKNFRSATFVIQREPDCHDIYTSLLQLSQPGERDRTPPTRCASSGGSFTGAAGGVFSLDLISVLVIRREIMCVHRGRKLTLLFFLWPWKVKRLKLTYRHYQCLIVHRPPQHRSCSSPRCPPRSSGAARPVLFPVHASQHRAAPGRGVGHIRPAGRLQVSAARRPDRREAPRPPREVPRCS